jgi:SAM-dependent methyltransferase
MQEDTRRFYAQTYDLVVRDWPGELDFYAGLAQSADRAGVLELGCGTGRIAIRLAPYTSRMVGLDNSPWMLEVARAKSAGISNLVWVEADMRSFDTGDTYGLVIIPGHAFLNLTTAVDQVLCLESIQRHLRPDGHLVIHVDQQDLDWLGSLSGVGPGSFEPAEVFTSPESGLAVRTSRAWAYDRSTQTATLWTKWEEMSSDDRISHSREWGPVPVHCAFPFEMEHLLNRTGYRVIDRFGDFVGGELVADSAEMIWVVAPTGRRGTVAR